MFTGSLQLDFGDWQKAGRIAITLAPVSWSDAGLAVAIPVGFMSDGASVPRLLWWFLPPWGDRATFAALLHDYLLDRLQGFEPGGPILLTRKECDGQFLAALLVLKVARWRAYLAWAGVRLHSIRLGFFGGNDARIMA
jgi:hypothetical protein